MERGYTKFIICLVFSVILANPTAAQEQAPANADDWLTVRLQGTIRPTDSWERIRLKMRTLYLAQDIDGGGISKSDHDLQQQREQAQLRVRPMSQWLRRDLDGDGKVTRNELKSIFGAKARQRVKHHNVWITPTPDQVTKILNKLSAGALKADKNEDGIISFDEALAHAKITATKNRRSSRTNQKTVPMSFDQDSDGVVSEAEFMHAVDRVLAAIDKDSNQAFSTEEIGALKFKAGQIKKAEQAWKRMQRLNNARRELVASCGFPKPPTGSKILLLGAHEGEALSTVALGGDDMVVTTANVKIDPGTEPLYILLTGNNPIIWQFSGSVDRVTNVIASVQRRDSEGAPRVGVVGLPADRVHIPTVAKCIQPFSKPGDAKSRRTAELVVHLTGRPADIVTGRYGLSSVQLPSSVFSKKALYQNTVKLPQRGPGAPLWRKMLRFNPGGLVRIDPKSVVSRSVAKPYKVLPQEAGLAQLLDAGALVAVGSRQVIMSGRTQIIPGDGDDRVVVPKGKRAAVSSIPKEFMIVEKLTFPAGLYGAHAVQFVLKPGVPRPDGVPGHSRIRE